MENPKINKIHLTGGTVLITILIISVVIRILAAFYMGDQVVELPGAADQISYHTLAIRVLGGYGFTFGQNWWPATLAGAPTAHWSYLYTFYLVFVYWLFGIHPLIARLIQVIIVGFLQTYLTYWIGKATFNERIGLIAAAISGLYIYSIYYSATLMTEPFYITLILITLALSISLSRTVDAQSVSKKNVYLGFALGGVILLRQLFLIFAPFILFWLIWTKRKQRMLKTFTQVSIVVGIILVMILPFTIYNYARFGRFVLLNTNSGFAFFWGNNPIYGTKFVPILTEDMGSYQQLIPANLQGLDEAALDQELLKIGIQFVRDDPVRYILLSISRIPVYFQFWPSAESGAISNISRVASFGIFLPFMIYGLALTIIRRNYGHLSDPKWLLLSFILIYSSIHLLIWALIRYRLPVDAILILFAAYGLNDVFERVWFQRRISFRLKESI